MMRLTSPTDGSALHADTPHSLSDGTSRWPVIDSIAFLRSGREALVADVLGALDRGDREAALMLLLADQDDWWNGPRARPEDLRRLVRGRATLSLREAMALLSWGPVGDYFAHRWSDPTFLGGLALVEAHWNAPASAFELACGIGHHLRELSRRGVAVGGADVVFAKLWVAKHWIVPAAQLVCFDAGALWPLADFRAELVVCHDAFYFLEPKSVILQQLRAIAGDGLLAISHVHNRDWPNLSAGSAMSAAEFGALFPDGIIYDDAELAAALVENRVPHPAVGSIPGGASSLAGIEAFSVVAGPAALPARPVAAGLALPPAGIMLRRNPLYVAGKVRWPSRRYAEEYGARATFPLQTDCPLQALSDDATARWARRRELVDLPERW